MKRSAKQKNRKQIQARIHNERHEGIHRINKRHRGRRIGDLHQREAESS